MALVLVNGTSALTDFTLGAGSGVSVKCIFGRITATFNRRSFEQTTFCSGGWVVEIMGMKQITFDLSGFVSEGNAYSDPSALFATSTPVAFVFTADTGCTYTGSGNAITDSETLTAAADSARNLQIRSSGSVTVAWVTS